MDSEISSLSTIAFWHTIRQTLCITKTSKRGNRRLLDLFAPKYKIERRR